MSSTSEGTLPLRPLTVGELLDAAIALLRGHAGPLLALAGALAVAEQLVLLPLRRAGDLTPPDYTPSLGHNWLAFLGIVGVGLGTEAVAITLLGAAAARYAVPAFLGPGLDRRRVGPGRWLAVVAVALVIGAGATLTWFAGGILWPLWYLSTGLIAPTLVADLRAPVAPRAVAGALARGPAGGAPAPVPVGRGILRGLGLVYRSGLRPGSIRLLNYLAWLLVRLALGYGAWITAEELLGVVSSLWLGVIATTGFAVADAVAYATAGCLDAVLQVEARIRLEGLDIAAGTARRLGTPLADVLRVPRPVPVTDWRAGVPR